MTDKERYRILCKKEASIPIFSMDWWLDAVCGVDGWDVYLIGWGMDIKAAFTYCIREDKWGRYIGRILLTQNNGIWIKYPNGQGITAKQSYEEKVINEVCDFIESLNLARYEQQYHYNFTNYLPFYWRYFQGIMRYTYVIEDTSDIERVREGYSSKLKNILRKARKNLYIERENDLGAFFEINRMSFVRQGIEIPYSYEYFKKIYEACMQKGSVELLCVKDLQCRTHSVAMLVWDSMSVYFLLNGTDPELKASQGNALLIDSSIEKAHELGLKFDFEGSVIKNVNHAYREFGGRPKAYFRIRKVFSAELIRAEAEMQIMQNSK